MQREKREAEEARKREAVMVSAPLIRITRTLHEIFAVLVRHFLRLCAPLVFSFGVSELFIRTAEQKLASKNVFLAKVESDCCQEKI